MHEFCPEGFERRHPKATKIHRIPLMSLGPNDEWSGDGHDKLCKIGMAIYGIHDKASGMWLGLWVVPNNRLNIVVAYLYLSLVEERGGNVTILEKFMQCLNYCITTGIPVQSTTDCGSETTAQYSFANLLRCASDSG